MNEEEIKIKLIDKISEEDISFIASEVKYLDSSCRVDLVALIGSHLHAFEIKSQHDTLTKLRRQEDSYRKCFDYVHVVANKSHLKNLRSIIHPGTGIIMEDKESLIEIRKPREIKRLDKYYLLSFLRKKELLSSFPNVKDKEIHNLRVEISKNNRTNKIREKVIDSLVNRYKNSYETFSFERGSVIHTDDLKILSRISKIGKLKL